MAQTRPTTNRLQRFGQAYTALAITLLSTLILFVLINAALYLFPSLRAEAAVDTPIRFFGADRLLPAYPGWTRDDLVQLHEESRVVFAYEPIVEFRIKPIAGRYVNATPEGYRLNARRAPWPPGADALNVFVFGGSTTFGWLLQDRDTIVSQLQDQIDAANCARPVAVYNFGQPSYISTQEALAFQSLLAADVVPDVAVFIDGFNEFFFRGEMSYTRTLRGMMDGSDTRHHLGALMNLPLYQLAKQVNARFYRPPAADLEAERPIFERIIAQWSRNKRAIETLGRAYGTSTAFVWQPVPSYQYDLGHHFLYRDDPFEAGEPVPYADIGRAYTAMSLRRAGLEAERNFLWLADMPAGKQENLFVDRLHYNAKFSGEIAGRILEFLNARNLVPCGARQGDAPAPSAAPE